MQWCRLYHEFATDPKVQMMPEAMQRRLVMLFCFQSDGSLETMDDETLAFALHIDAAELKKTRELFVKKGFIDKDSWQPRNWEKRQRASDDTNERVKRYRERNGRVSNDPVTLQKRKMGGSRNVTCNVFASPSVSESGISDAGAPPPAPPPASPPRDAPARASDTGAHAKDESPAAVQVRYDAVRRWSAIDADAEVQANELIRAWGAPLAAHGLEKAFRKFGGREKPWAYANAVCRGGMPPPSSRGSPAPSGGQNGSSSTVTPSQRLKAEEPEPPLTTEQLRETVAMLEGIRRRLPWQETLLEQSREELGHR